MKDISVGVKVQLVSIEKMLNLCDDEGYINDMYFTSRVGRHSSMVLKVTEIHTREVGDLFRTKETGGDWIPVELIEYVFNTLSKKVKPGKTLLVRDCRGQRWKKRVLVEICEGSMYPYRVKKKHKATSVMGYACAKEIV